jgi:hypothetical protein
LFHCSVCRSLQLLLRLPATPVYDDSCVSPRLLQQLHLSLSLCLDVLSTRLPMNEARKICCLRTKKLLRGGGRRKRAATAAAAACNSLSLSPCLAMSLRRVVSLRSSALSPSPREFFRAVVGNLCPHLNEFVECLRKCFACESNCFNFIHYCATQKKNETAKLLKTDRKKHDGPNDRPHHATSRGTRTDRRTAHTRASMGLSQGDGSFSTRIRVVCVGCVCLCSSLQAWHSNTRKYAQ